MRTRRAAAMNSRKEELPCGHFGQQPLEHRPLGAPVRAGKANRVNKEDDMVTTEPRAMAAYSA